MNEQKADSVNHPKHYTWLKELCGIEVIDITRHVNHPQSKDLWACKSPG